MTKVEASTLQEAYALAASELSCSVTQLQCEVIQYPSKGLFGLFQKKAIIVATRKTENDITVPKESVSPEEEKDVPASMPEAVIEEKPMEEAYSKTPLPASEDTIVEGFFETDQENSAIERDNLLSESIEESLKHLFEVSCFDIDVVEVDVVDNTALIFIDGEDAALLIGKEGYRYNALSYMLFNWLHSKYQLYIKLEIAAFLTSQQEMIRNYLQPVIENVHRYGKAKTRFLDGILVQIALEQLREAFPDKYVAIKTARSGKRFVVVNAFNAKHHA